MYIITSVYIRQNAINIHNFSADSGWVILSPMEMNIKQKIEKIGKPLKDWDISINYGIKTGFNEAFIIDGQTKDALIAKSPKNAEIIRPILRGRDIKKYKTEFADLWLIATLPSLKINIDDYPDIKNHLLSFGKERLEQSGNIGARKKTGNKWFETQDAISYYKEFEKEKIIYPNMSKFLPFYLDNNGFMQNDKSFMITGKHLAFLVAFLNSSLFKFCFIDNFPELQGGTRELRKIFFDKIPVIQVSDTINLKFEEKLLKLQNLIAKQLPSKNIELEIDEMIFNLYSLNGQEKKEIGFIEIE
jgi:hypothetical protein